MKVSNLIYNLLSDENIIPDIDLLSDLGFKIYIDEIKETGYEKEINTLVNKKKKNAYKLHIKLVHEDIPTIYSGSSIVDLISAINTFQKMFKAAIILHMKKNGDFF